MAVATAVPPFVLDQSDVARRVEYVFGSQRDIRYLIPIFGNAGISRRYSCVPVEWYTEPHGWKERNDLYLENAVALFCTRCEWGSLLCGELPQSKAVHSSALL